MWIRSVYIFCIVLFMTTIAHCTKRHISCTVYPVYNDSTAEVTLNLIYVKAVSAEDTVHYLWSTYKLPSVIVARTTTDTELKIDFHKMLYFQRDAITFSKKPIAVIGLTVSEIWELLYNSDKASITDTSSQMSLGLEFFKWSIINNETFDCSDALASAKLNSTNQDDESFSKGGRFELEFSAQGNEETASDSPHLIYSGNSTQVRFAFNDLYSNSSRTRYGLEMIVFSSMYHNCSETECKAVAVDSISDEFSPGIFSDVDIFPPCYEKDDKTESFLTWRPVAYTSEEISVASSSDAKMTSKCLHYSISDIRSIAELYFIDHKDISENSFNITFGAEGDGFYPKTKYTSWTLMVGTGSAVHPKLSISAIVFISVSLGALVLFFLIGGIYLTVRQFSKKKTYVSFTDGSVN